MSLEFAAHLANFAADELVSTRKELNCVNNRYKTLYNDHENLKDAMAEMEKKLRQLEKTVARQDEELARREEAEKKWSIPHILREIEDEWAKAVPDTYKIEKLNAKHEAAVKIEDSKSLCLLI